MKPATTGERIVWGDAACASEWILDSFRKEIARADDRRKVAAIDAAIAEAVKVKMEAILEVCNEQASQAIREGSHHALLCAQAIRNAVLKHHTDAMAAIRERGNP